MHDSARDQRGQVTKIIASHGAMSDPLLYERYIFSLLKAAQGLFFRGGHVTKRGGAVHIAKYSTILSIEIRENG